MSRADAAMVKILDREGGYANHPDDLGGETNFGITEAVARAHGYEGAMRDLDRGTAIDIYRQKYWLPMKLDQIADIYPAVADQLFDIAVNSGVAHAAKLLQRCLNVFNRRQADYADVVVDGAVGMRTLAALREYHALRGFAGGEVLLHALVCLQGAHYVEIAERRPQNATFVYGWIRQRIKL